MAELTRADWNRGVDNELAALRLHYPHEKPPEGEWVGRLKAYREKLEVYALPIVIRACKMAPAADYFPRFFPTSGQLELLCRKVQAETRTPAKGSAAHDPGSAVDPAEYYADVPRTAEDQEQWLDSATSPFERLARSFKLDSFRRGLDPNKTTPSEVGSARARAINELFPGLMEIP